MRKTVPIDGGVASVLSWGPDDADVTLVGVHGAAHSADVFRRVFDHDALAATRRIAIDLPGRFGSIDRARSSGDDASFVNAVVDACGRRGRIVLVGHSYGGAVAIEVAIGGGADALTLVSTGARLRVRADILETYAAAAASNAPAPKGLGFSDEVPLPIVDALERAFSSVPSGAGYADWTSANAFDRMSELASIRCPTLILAGDDDPFTPLKYGEFLASRIVGAELVRLAHGSHLAIVERADEVAHAIGRFIASATSAPR